MSEYSPAWAPHVTGTYGERVPDGDGGWEEQKVHIVCSECGAKWVATCTSGNPRSHVTQFAKAHAHRDPLLGKLRS